MVEPSSSSLSLSSFMRFRLSRILALGLVVRPVLVFLGLTSSEGAGAGVGGFEWFVSFNFGFEPPGVTRGVGVLREGARLIPAVLRFNFSLRPLILPVL